MGVALGSRSGAEGDGFLQGAKLLAGDYAPQGALAIAHKDNALMLEQGRAHGTPLLLTSLYAQLLNVAWDRVDPTLDSAVVYEILREMAGLPRRA